MKKLYAYKIITRGVTLRYDEVSDIHIRAFTSMTEIKYFSDIDTPTIDNRGTWHRAPEYDILVPDVHSTKDT